MALLTRLTKYDIEDSNIALLGSDLEKEVREHAGDKELAWDSAGREPHTQVWRIEQFSVKEWPKSHFGHFYDGDSYIVLHTYKKNPDTEDLSHDLHFWLGSETTQDEAGTAAYKTVELDDHLGGAPVEYREIQSYESSRFLSYFPRFVCLRGGIASGFHHVSEAPPDNTRRLFRISSSQVGGRATAFLQIREVPAEGSSIEQGGVYVLDIGNKIWQFNTQQAAGKVKYKAAEFVQSLVSDRQGQCDTTVYDEHGDGAGMFLLELGLQEVPPASTAAAEGVPEKSLFRFSDASGEVTFEPVFPPTEASLSPDDAFILDDSANRAEPGIYVWVGSRASRVERRLALEYGQRYLYKHRQSGGRAALATHIVRMDEGRETDAFIAAISS
ncbi:fragmin60 [Lentinus tigrinus ALCF2SS1-7]|uniref:Fragmin60 n=1 Tax=Lentinus tigrinus ALCF2SS1-6 TaxID=1328759 RepID=A0A5C2SGI8_9APHY|nr:fragmin60 [Lentinus tigrinus ALCF2SS1-6]RPD77931.1 fragmin60 [Lentinus tigrinus ALCF2SS1-7]